jgi:flagellar hook assembly protein FlgD
VLPPERRRLPLPLLRLLALAAATLPALAAAVGTAPRVDAPPTLSGVGSDYAYFSPNLDGSQDTLHVFYGLGGDTAQVLVQVRADSLGLPGKIRRTLRDDVFLPGPDTVRWEGRDDSGTRVLDGLYWITLSAANALGSAEADPLPVILDITNPDDAVTLPARGYLSGLIHRVEGLGADANRLESFEVRLSSPGGALTTVLCQPCLTDTVRFGIDVPDSIATADTLTVRSSLRDNAGNEINRVRLFVVDSLPPPPPAIAPYPERIERSELVITGTAAGAESVLVSLDGSASAAARVQAGGSFAVALRGFAPGPHAFSAVSQDRAQNRSRPTAPAAFTYEEPLGATLPERFRAGDFIQVNLARPARSVTVKIYTLSGRLVRSFAAAGGALLHEFEWNLDDDDGRAVGSGPYVVRILAEADDGTPLEKRLATVATR